MGRMKCGLDTIHLQTEAQRCDCFRTAGPRQPIGKDQCPFFSFSQPITLQSQASNENSKPN